MSLQLRLELWVIERFTERLLTFNTLIENEIGAPVAVAKALLGHRIKGRDAHGAYTKPTPEQLIKVVAAFQAMVFPPG